jgi:hypothetical protein
MREAETLRYRVHGGTMKVDQRLTLREDGTAELDERHRRRGATTLALGATEMDALRAVLDQVPEGLWSRVPPPLRIRGRDLWRIFGIGQQHFVPLKFSLRRQGRNLAGWLEDPDQEVADLLRRLEDIRARAVREAEAQSPT